MSSSTPLIKSRFLPLFIVAACAALLLSGCVYLRLLELKKQFSQFDENFTVLPSEGLTLHCLHPVLQPDDVRWLGGAPKTVTPGKKGESWVIRWVKEPPPNLQEAFVYDMELDLHFVDGCLVDMSIPKRHLAYVSRDLIITMLRSTGKAKVDRSDRKAEVQTETSPSAVLPNINTIKAMLGEPTRRPEPTDGLLIYFYRYRLDVAKPSEKPIEVTFAFDPGSGDLRQFTALLPRGTLKYEFPPTAKPPATEVEKDKN